MRADSSHRGQVFTTPWPGVHGTLIDSTRHYGRHWHTTFGFGLLERGAQRSASGRGEVSAYAGDLITTNPGEVHDGRPLDGASRRWRMVYLEPDAMAEVLAAPAGAGEFTRPVLRDARLQRAVAALFDRLDGWRARGDDAAALACDEALAHCCEMLLGGRAVASRSALPFAELRAVRDRLADAALEAPSLAVLAAQAGLSRYQLLRRFSAAFGLPPHAWLLQQRAERARRLIRGGASLALAAAEAGFADQSHLTRIFVRQFGYTPGAWQRAMAVPRALQ
ncbi:AraC family transcriptional regulator [Aquincola sp. S2]|uniref:AraC family transcriptional regulator n=1 Tax=Pseudaquabacterium terrae TaxID=2732868 RepID=A0ABX2E9B9_9BURK|nr:AraC family transcriptional regulator [Aquabacterium terrae]NRF65574.1 AraC family transcriptional regulator [Aquabacterium terrae]